MGILSFLGNKASATPISAVGKIIDNLFTSKDEKLTHQEIRMRIEQKPSLIQAEINKIEAQHRRIFVAGWRPAVGWVCAASLAYVSIIEPIARFVATYKGFTGDFPVIDTTITNQILMALLGFGAYRSFEKIKGVAK